MIPGTSWSFRGRSVESSRKPGTLKPWKRIGLNSMISPVQLMSQPITPVKTGIDAAANQSTSLDAARKVTGTSIAGPSYSCRDAHDDPCA